MTHRDWTGAGKAARRVSAMKIGLQNMLNVLFGQKERNCEGASRRSFLQVGFFAICLLVQTFLQRWHSAERFGVGERKGIQVILLGDVAGQLCRGCSLVTMGWIYIRYIRYIRYVSSVF